MTITFGDKFDVFNSPGAIGFGTNVLTGERGQMLQSNGGDSPPSWTTGLLIPYYFRAQKATNQTTTTAGTIQDVNSWSANLPSPFNANNGDLAANGVEWICPTNGLYNVNARLNMYNGNDYLKEAQIQLQKQPVGGSYSIVAESLFVIGLADATDIVTASPTFTDLIPMNAGDKLKVTFLFKTSAPGSTLYIFSGVTSVWNITRDAVAATPSGLPQALGTTSSPTFTNLTVNEIDGGISNVSIKYDDTAQTPGRLRFNTGIANLFFVMRNDEFNCWNGSSANGLYLNYNGGTVYHGNPPSALSDDRIKFNETNITNGLEVIRKLSPERYTKRLPNQTTGIEEAGFIAQEVLTIPELKFAVTHPNKEIIEGDPNTRYYTLTYDSIFTYAVAGLKELDTIVQKQAQLISSLEARIKTLEGK